MPRKRNNELKITNTGMTDTQHMWLSNTTNQPHMKHTGIFVCTGDLFTFKYTIFLNCINIFDYIYLMLINSVKN